MKSGLAKYTFLSVCILIVLMGCNLTSGALPATDQNVPTATLGVTETQLAQTQTQDTQTQIVDSPTQTPQPTTASELPPSTETLPPPTATSGPFCTILQDLNMRSGPGTAYRPPIRSLPAQTIIEPLGYNPVGVPGGPWLQANDRSNNQIGWVSAGSQYVSCNIDLTSLPSVAVAPPAPPPPPSTNNSTPDGTFPPTFVWEADFNKEYFVRFRVYDTSAGGTKDGDGIISVAFQVLDENGNEVYQRTERQAGFCIFGGGEPSCNPWTIENFSYVWKPGGEAVKEGNYKLLIVVSAASGEQGNWNYDFKIKLP
jgi:hypothetical protein